MAVRWTRQGRETERQHRRVAEPGQAAPEFPGRTGDDEASVRALVANIPGALYRGVIQPPGRDSFISEGIHTISGFHAREFLEPGGPAWGDLVLPEDRAEVEQTIAVAVAERRAYRVRYRIRHRDGSIRWVSDQGCLAGGTDGTPHEVEGLRLDVTADMQTERSLRDQEMRLRTILETVPECVKLLGPDGHLLDMNPAGLVMIEAESFQQVRGQSIRPFIHPADEPAFREMIEAVFRGESRRLAFDIVGLKGTRRTMETHSVPLWDSPGRYAVRALLGVTRDITERRRDEIRRHESEERYRTLVASVPGAVYLGEVTAPWRDTYMSEGVRAVTGYGPEEFLRPGGITFGDITLPEDLPGVVAQVEAGVATRQPIEMRYRIRHADGSVRWVHDLGRVAYDQEGQPLFFGGVVLDVTAAVHAEEVRQTLEARLRQSQKLEAVGTLAGGIAHDFNNILTAILANAELLMADPAPDEGTRESLGGILSAGNRARELVQQILTFSRRGERVRTRIALQPVVLEALKLLRATLPSTIEVRTEIAQGGALVLADATEVHQVIVNLCTNAAHAMREGGGALEVRYADVAVDAAFVVRHEGLQPGPHARLTISDSGQGMAPEVVERIFEPFFTTKGPAEGTGLGLAVVHGIMLAHDGAVTVESCAGRGTTFELYFPAVAGVPAAPAAEAAAPPRGRGERVMVVDDEPSVVKVATRILARLGYDATGYVRPAEALEVFARQPDGFDLVICDLTMPEMTGVALATRLLELRPDLPILLTSGNGDALGKDELERQGILELVAKPFCALDLAEAVERALH